MTGQHRKVAVIGGGAAGMMAAGYAAELGAAVTLYEKNRVLGRKLRITGKGRCNLTNACDNETFIRHVLRNPRFLYTAIHAFSTADTMSFFENAGLPLKVERGNRVFPVSDQSADVVEALRRYLERGGVRCRYQAVTALSPLTEGGWRVTAGGQDALFDAVIVATGGASYPLTGSTGDGYRFADRLGLGVIPPRPSLVPLISPDPVCAAMQGLSLRNVGISAFDRDNKKLYEDFGELLFTHFGLSGPTVLSLSAAVGDKLSGGVRVSIDLKPALTPQMLDERLRSDFLKYANRIFANALDDLLPQKMIAPFIARTKIAPDRRVNSLTREERLGIGRLFKDFSITVNGTRPLAEAIVTAGGVDVRELDPRTMRSKRYAGLFFAGEVIDVDAYTGGFNLQIAFATARLAAGAAAREE